MIRASNAIGPEWLSEYRTQLEALWGQIVYLNSYNYIMGNIAQFPWHLFSLNQNYFFDCIFAAMLESCVSIVYRIVIDTNSKTLTLPAFKNKVLEHLIDPAVRDSLKSELDNLSFNKEFKEYKNLFIKIRHEEISHFNRERNTKLTEAELRQRQELVNQISPASELIGQLFQILCLGKVHLQSLSEYSQGKPFFPKDGTVSDIEKLLDWVADQSPLLHMPEDEPQVWSMFRRKYSAEDIETINTYRRKFNLPKIT
ncbi:MAG: hypothetical protein U9N55_06540 [candidate division Zixibacteria bacterium]|nr:hypothetical protein [candidate division Zixibacteria bacterium]